MIDPLVMGIDPFCNEEGCIRLKKVRDHFGLNFDLVDLPQLIHIYTTWRDTVELMPIRLIFKESRYVDLSNSSTSPDVWIDYYKNAVLGWEAVRFNDASDIVCYEGKTYEWDYIKSCKRGNDVYIKHIRKKFDRLIDSKSLPAVWSTVVNKKRKRVRKTKMLYITGTVSHLTCGSCGKPVSSNRKHCSNCGSYVFVKKPICDRWINFGKYWNSFITNIREQFGGVDYIRIWQSQKNGFPHFHALVYFHNFKFTATKHYNKKGKLEWRVHNRQKKNGKLISRVFKDAWKQGFIDVKCCDNTKKALIDIKKYITRDLEGGESDLTNTMVWYYRKRAFSVSKGFLERFGVKESIAEPSDADSINASGVTQRSNSKKKLLSMEIFPHVRRDNLDFSYTKDVLDLNNSPDPPPKVCDYFEDLLDSCERVKVNKKLLNDGSVIDVVIYKRKEFF